MNIIQKIIDKLDNWQQSHTFSGFVYGVVKKYGEDETGYQAALLTYYGFLSLFPLLLVLTTLTSIIAGSHPQLQATIVNGMTNYIPVLGTQVSEHVHTLHKSGPALAIGLLLTFYGARGVADVFQHGVNHIWQNPPVEQAGFPQKIFKSLRLIIVGGAGLILASVSSGFAAGAGQGLDFRLLSIVINLVILFWMFAFLINESLTPKIPLKNLRAGAASAAIGLVVLQAAGTYLLAHELKSLDALYSYFAIALGLLFWIYLQAQMVYYSVEIAAVKTHRDWPRSLGGRLLTEADKRLEKARIK